MKERGWYEADVLLAGLKSHRHTTRGASEAEIERRMRDLYRDVVAVLVRAEKRIEADREGAWRR